jgi:Ni/Co efflux regulator RcnB
MFRTFAIAATLALVLPSLAAAQQHDEHKGQPHPAPHPGGAPPPHPGPGGPHPQFKQVGPQHGPVHPGPGPMAGPHPGPGPMAGPRAGGAQFSFHGHAINRVHVDPFRYPSGWAYRQWAVGAILPPLFLVHDYWYADWAALGLPPPQPGYEWVRYGPDLLLVDISTGQVVDVAYGVFYE